MSHYHEATLIFPHHLFQEHPGLAHDRKIFLIEEQLFFGDYYYQLNFHQQKLVLHRASLKAYQDLIESRGYEVEYIPYHPQPNMDYIFNKLEQDNIKKVYYAELMDWALKRRLNYYCQDKNIKKIELEGPGFLTSLQWIDEYFKSKKKYFLTSFYIEQRKKLKILIEDDKPVGGKWSYDKENRKKIPAGTTIPPIPSLNETKVVKEAKKYVNKHFPDNPGSVDGFNYPTTHQEAFNWFIDFVKHRLPYFGDYEDAILADESFLFHSIISSSLNIGLLTPQQLLDEVLKASKIPINSLEGFIRQIIGWREFLRVIYLREGVKQRTTNFLNHKNKMNDKLYYGHTGLKPYDVVVKRVIKYAFTHHIERLMILGNLMLLVNLDPDEIYQWFMEMFIDSYDWVMVPNVYGMSQYADGGIITTKPYFSSSNYIRKMSDFKADKWVLIWDALFWRFMDENRKLIAKNPRLAVLKPNLNKEKKMKAHRSKAHLFLKELYR